MDLNIIEENEYHPIFNEILNIKHEPEREFVLILPEPVEMIQPRKIKSEETYMKEERTNKQIYPTDLKIPRKSFSCEQCHRKCASKSEVLRHIAIVHDTEKASCKVCGKTFKNKFSLIAHEKVHGKHKIKIIYVKVSKYILRHLYFVNLPTIYVFQLTSNLNVLSA